MSLRLRVSSLSGTSVCPLCLGQLPLGQCAGVRAFYGLSTSCGAVSSLAQDRGVYLFGWTPHRQFKGLAWDRGANSSCWHRSRLTVSHARAYYLRAFYLASLKGVLV